MFDEILREMKKLERPRRISVSVPLDDKGYFDRACPANECGGQFKVLSEDWESKVSDARAFCPFCGYAAPADEWNTDDQQEYIESVATAEMSRLLNGAMKEAVRRTRPQKIGNGLFSISMQLSYKPGPTPIVLPAAASSELRQDFVCESCRCRYASLGASFFCPACGHNSASSCFDNTLETVRKTIEALPTLQITLGKSADADIAKDAVRQLLEDQFPRLVGAFERLNEALFQRLPNAAQLPRSGSVFQRLDDASALWQRACGKGYGYFVSQGEMLRLRVLFERRHVLSHRQGIVDQKYIDRSGDQTYAVGQRVGVRDGDVLGFVNLLAKIATGLRSLV